MSFDGPAVFYQWMPIEPDDEIAFVEEDVRVSMRWTIKSAVWASEVTADSIANTVNNQAYRMFVEASLPISSELGAHITMIDREIGPLADEYKDLGQKLQSTIVRRVNRFSGYARAVKGQFWVDEFQSDDMNPSQFFIRHEARATIDGVAVRFDPDRRTIRLTGRMQDTKMMITASDWPEVREFVAGERGLPLVGLLLANARSLAAEGNRRNALVEAVTALEVSLSEFAKKCQLDVVKRFGEGVGAENVQALISKVGLRGAFAFALPLLFTETRFPRSLLEQCRAAIDKRNNIVHRGARGLDEDELRKVISAIEMASTILEEATDLDAD